MRPDQIARSGISYVLSRREVDLSHQYIERNPRAKAFYLVRIFRHQTMSQKIRRHSGRESLHEGTHKGTTAMSILLYVYEGKKEDEEREKKNIYHTIQYHIMYDMGVRRKGDVCFIHIYMCVCVCVE